MAIVGSIQTPKYSTSGSRNDIYLKTTSNQVLLPQDVQEVTGASTASEALKNIYDIGNNKSLIVISDGMQPSEPCLWMKKGVRAEDVDPSVN